MNLNEFRSKKYSQNAEDGILLKIFEIINFTNHFVVEIGVGDGNECCSRILAENHKCRQLMFDMNHEHKERGLFKEFITVENIIPILDSHNVPIEPDFLGIDIDSFDFYIAHTILKKYRPRVLVVETNPTFLLEDKVVKLGKECQGFWAYHGAGLMSWYKSLDPLGYHLVCHEFNGINAFFVRAGLIQTSSIDNYNNVEKLFSTHEGKPNCSLSNYKMYPSSFEILTSEEALKLIPRIA